MARGPLNRRAAEDFASYVHVVHTVVCFGEVLWDCLPQALFLGGAPLNVAYHLRKLGARPRMVSAVGADFLGELVLERMAEFGLETDLIGRTERLQTGAVKVMLNAEGNATYDILHPVAWDRIPVGEAVREAVAAADALVFGSLALRGVHNAEALSQLLELTGPLRVFDVNLRAPYWDREAVLALCRRVDVVKLNDEELAHLTGAENPPVTADAALTLLERLREETGCPRICVTRGAAGAVFLDNTSAYEATPPPVRVADTVGAGDAFTAAFVTSLLRGEADRACAQGCALGAFVASRSGAQPPYRSTEVPGLTM